MRRFQYQYFCFFGRCNRWLLSVLFLLVVNFAKGSQISNPQIIPNKGQWESVILAKIQLFQGDFWITKKGFVLLQWNSDQLDELHHEVWRKIKVDANVTRWDFLNPNSLVYAEFGGEKSAEYYNYFKGSDKSKWVSKIKKYAVCRLRNVWNGVDLQIETTPTGIKYNWITTIQHLSDIQIVVNGSKVLKLGSKSIQLSNPISIFTDKIPQSFVKSNSAWESFNVEFQLNHLQDDFEQIKYSCNSQDYALEDSIIIDPYLVFSTFSGSRADNFGCTGTYDNLGNGYAGGTVFDFGLPVTSGAIQMNFNGGVNEDLGYGGDRDAAILKFSNTGSQLLFCTYLGGSNNEQPHSMVVDNSGNLFIMGSTRSSDFPILSGSYKKTLSGNYDFFVVRIDPTGTNLMGSTFFGGSGLDAVGADRSTTSVDDFPLLYNYADEFRGEIITDQQNVYVAGVSYSIDFPRSSSRAFGGKSDGVVFSLNASLSSLNWSEYFGSTGFDALYGIALGKNSDLYVAGGTTSMDLNRIVGFNSYQGGLSDGFIVKYDKNTGVPEIGRYYGTNQYDQAYFVQTDPAGLPHIFGQTEGQIPNSKNPRFHLPNTPQFIVSFLSDLSDINWQSSFGATINGSTIPNISPSAFLIDRCGRFFVSGWGGGTNQHLVDVFTFQQKKHRNKGNTRNMPISNDAAQKSTDGSDFYIGVFSKNMYSLAYATYFGGVGSSNRPAEEHVDGGTSRFDAKGIIYQAVCAGCRQNGLFPTTPSAYSKTMNSDNCNNALFKIDFENLNKKPITRDTFISVIATSNIDFTITATDPDPFDTLLTKVFLLKKGGMKGTDTAVLSSQMGIGSATIRVQWNTICSSWSKDTVVYKVMTYDRGCPQADTVYSFIKILVTEPPTVTPPSAICVSFDRQTSQMKISWPPSVVPVAYFKYFLLRRTNPDGTTQVLDTIWNNNAGQHLDANVVNPRQNNYCYELIGYNICDVAVFAKLIFCTTRELNNPINGVPVYTATVKNDKYVEVRWQTSDEPDFKEFEVYKYPRGSTSGKIPVLTTTDTFFRDSNLTVDNESFCYQVLVADQCGHISSLSNEGCNVVLQGSAIGAPNYAFPIWWNNYQGWNDGVKDWYVERKDDAHPFSIIQTNWTNLSLIDNKLDYDWGGYWYRVTAQRNTFTDPTQSLSESNWIYLYQSPEVWVPTGISRNNDGLNDSWGTVPVFVREYKMVVYDRWGKIIWESSNKKSQWLPILNENELPDGVYAWKVDFWGWDDKHYSKTGTVTVLH